jgi:dienelactone hydrolase
VSNFLHKCFAVAALAALELAQTPSLSAEELVKFASAAASRQSEAKPDIQGYLTKPKGSGPFPAVVLLHSCLGLPANRRSIASTIAGWGYVALFVDDFATRGLEETCAVDFSPALSDAYGALAFLARLPEVDPTRVAAIGYSQGADTALQIAASRSPAAAPGDLKFKAAAAFYPPCANQANAALHIPTLILIGASDEVTPAADCERLKKAQPGGANVRLVVYPSAAHLFDDPAFADGKRLFGMWMQYDRSAAEQAKVELRGFLAATLAR